MTNISIRNFDITKIREDSTIFIIGRKTTGKTTLACDILYHKQTIPTGIIISPRDHKISTPHICMLHEYNPNIIVDVIKRQKVAVTKWYNENRATGGKSTYNPYSFLFMDDCTFDASWTKDRNIYYLFMNSRCLKNLILITMQYPLSISPVLRTNVDYIFIFRENNMQNRKRLYKQYGGMFPTFEAFAAVIDALGDYEYLVINNNAASNKLEDQVFFYKAKPLTLRDLVWEWGINDEQTYINRCKEKSLTIRDELFDAVCV